jgi:hypothetical protein
VDMLDPRWIIALTGFARRKLSEASRWASVIPAQREFGTDSMSLCNNALRMTLENL